MAKERTPNIGGTGTSPATERLLNSILPALEKSASIVNLKVAVLALGTEVEKLKKKLAALQPKKDTAKPAKKKR